MTDEPAVEGFPGGERVVKRITDEMREAGGRASDPIGWAWYDRPADDVRSSDTRRLFRSEAFKDADASYLAMFALDPEVAELRDNLRMTQKAHLMTCQELVNADNEAQIMEEFLTAQGYVRGEDGTWGESRGR